MEVAALVISLIAVGTSIVALWYGHRADTRETRRFAREERETEKVKRARLTAQLVGSNNEGPEGRLYRYRITNQGPAAARRVSVWFVDDQGAAVGRRGGGRIPLAKDADHVFLPVAPRRDVYSGPLRLRYGWMDDREEWQEQDSNVEVPLN